MHTVTVGPTYVHKTLYTQSGMPEAIEGRGTDFLKGRWRRPG